MNRVQAFREVDRGFFAPKERQHEAYYDQPIKCGNLHMSAPHIYGTSAASFLARRCVAAAMQPSAAAGSARCMWSFLQLYANLTAFDAR